MDKIIIIDDSGIQEKLDKFLSANKNHVRLSADMDEVSLRGNSAFMEILKYYEEKHKLKIHTKDKVWFYKINEVLRFEAVYGKTRIYFSNGSTSLLNVTIDEIENQLRDFPFFKIHSSHIINGNYISRITDSPNGLIELTNGDSVPIKKSYKKQILNFINKSY